MTTTLNIDLLRKVWNMAEQGLPDDHKAAEAVLLDLEALVAQAVPS